MSGIAIAPEMMALLEDAGLAWERAQDGSRLDVGPDLWDGFDRWQANPDGSVDLFAKQERGPGFDHRAWFASWTYAERWMARALGAAARGAMPVVGISPFREDIDPRCALVEVTVVNRRRIGVRVGEEYIAALVPHLAAEATHVLLEQTEAIIRSFRDPEGRPLYGVADIVPPSLRA
ncbi:hypothetical protein [Demequina subtropica]|uniref:hypothetical protein n=1 Tax=Demequina subtropica TaxID=1638989 RepID=UPI0007831BD0|nr:hypothetical protein [Demequina subtropica]